MDYYVVIIINYFSNLPNWTSFSITNVKFLAPPNQAMDKAFDHRGLVKIAAERVGKLGWVRLV